MWQNDKYRFRNRNENGRYKHKSSTHFNKNVFKRHGRKR